MCIALFQKLAINPLQEARHLPLVVLFIQEGNFLSPSCARLLFLVFFKPTDVMPNFALKEQTEVIGSF